MGTRENSRDGISVPDESEISVYPVNEAPRLSMPPAGSFLPIDSGPHQGRIYQDSGHIAIAGPDLAGGAHANVITFAPPVIHSANRTFDIGRVVSSNPVANGLEIVQEVGTQQIRAQLTFPLEGILRYEVVDWQGLIPDRVVVSAASESDEHFYGLGEKFNALDQTGKLVDILTFDNPGSKGDRSYKVTPWFISTRGYGFHFDSTARCRFDLRRTLMASYSLTNQASTLKFNVVYGPKLGDVLTRYTGMTGRPALPPPWAFGPWISADIWRTGGEIRYAVTKFRERGISASAFVFDSPWEVAYNDFDFNKRQFEKPARLESQMFDGFANVAEMMTFLRENGLKVICWMTPFVNVSSNDESVPGQNLGRAKNYAAGADGRFFVRESPNGPPLVVPWWKGRGSPIDFTKKEARDWLTAQLQHLLAASEVATKSGKEPAIGGFKTDDGEVGNGTNTYIPDTASYSDGRSGREFVNGYCLEYHRTVYSVLGAAGTIFARSGFAGTQAFGGGWAGDNEPNFGSENGLPSVIIAGLSAAMSGYSIWGHDIGGYENQHFSPVSPSDLFMRWTQFGCFSPIMQMHRQVDPANLRHYPWGYAQADESTENNRALDNYRFYASLHTRLFPYLYTYAKQSQDTGLPILRPLVLLHQDDSKALGVEHTYYFGRDLLVAPIFEPTTTQRRVYLPEGTWFDFWTNEQHAGKQDVTWHNPTQPAEPQSKIPVFVRSGAIVPLILGESVVTLCDPNYINNTALNTWDGGIEVSIYPSGVSSFTMFDGTIIDCVEAATTMVTIRSAVSRRVVLRIHAPRPATVRLDGTVLTEVASAAAFDAATAGWRFDAAPAFVLVKFPQPSGIVSITL
ncbi:MAG: glycoside hydrolase family 31 protein [Bryobacteraceae bacterium]